MARNQSRDPLVLSAHWHVDCRLPAELPDDRVVSSRFLVNLPFGAATLALLMFFGWELSTDLSLRSNIADWARRLSDSRVEVASIKAQQREYTTIAFKIETAYNLMKNRLFVSHFMSQLSHSRPGPMVIDNVESLDNAIIVRGSLSGTAEDATRSIGAYVSQLQKDPEIGPRFDSILVTSFERARGGDQQNFELTFRFKPEGQPMNPFDSNEVLGLFRRYLFCSICSLLSLILIAGIWILWQDVHTLESLNRERSQEGQAMLSTLVSGPLIRQELARGQDIVQRIEGNLIVESNLADNYAYFFKIQAETKSDLIFLRQQNGELGNDDSDYKVIPFSLQLAGTYEQVAAFLLKVETGPKLAKIKSFSFHRREQGLDSLTLNIELKLLGKR